MAVNPREAGVERLDRIALVSADAQALSAFYVEVLGFERVIDTHPSIRTMMLTLGGTRLELIDVGSSPRTYPDDVPGSSPLFQHFAIVVADVDEAMRRLRTSRAWSSITVDGPQRLPAAAGGATAFKFRDPEGHPLELLALPDAAPTPGAGPFVRIDHSALSVVDVERSIAFYRTLGLDVVGRSLNAGDAQGRLDAIDDVEVRVVSLALPSGGEPHVELLGYRGARERDGMVGRIDDVTATRLVFAASAAALAGIAERHAGHVENDPASTPAHGSALLLRDPDGHLLQFEAVPAADATPR